MLAVRPLFLRGIMLSFQKWKTRLAEARARREEAAAEADWLKHRIAALERAFALPRAALREMFPEGAPIEEIPLPAYPGAIWLGEVGIYAFVQSQSIEVDDLPRYRACVAAGKLDTLFAESEVTGGQQVRVLTRDMALLSALSDFSPPPPWVAWPELGPLAICLQGDAAHWYESIWDRYWEGLSLPQQAAYLKRAEARMLGNIDPETWQDWLETLRMRDHRTRHLTYGP